MGEIKTKVTRESVSKYLSAVKDPQKREDAKKICKMMEEITGEKPKMWGNSMIGFGEYHYKSERSSQEGDWPISAFAPRKQDITIYVMKGMEESQDFLKKLGKHKASSGSCLYIKRLSDVDEKVLKQIIKNSVEYMRQKYKVK